MSVVALFSALKNLFVPKSKGADISSNTFRVARWMGIFLVCCSILTSSKQFFGEPIQCKPNYLTAPMFNAYCFMTGTITILDETRTENLDEDHAHLGIASMKTGRRMKHNYYQWVPFILFFQAMLFYAPHRIWKKLEGGKLNKLLVKVSSDPLTETTLEEQVQGISNFLALNRGWYTSFARKMFFCELAIFMISLLQMYLLDLIFGGQFFRLGHDFLTVRFSWEHYRVLEEVFPLVTNCEMNYIGTAGAPITDSGLCVLAINIVNQKIFIISWFLHILVTLFSGLQVLFEVILMIVPSLRHVLLRSRAKTLPTGTLLKVHRHSGFGHFTLLRLISNNIDGAQFETLLSLLAEQFTTGSDPYPSSLIHMTVHSTGKKEASPPCYHSVKVI